MGPSSHKSWDNLSLMHRVWNHWYNRELLEEERETDPSRATPLSTNSLWLCLTLTWLVPGVVGGHLKVSLPLAMQASLTWALDSRMYSVRISKIVLIISYLKLLHSLSPLDAGKPAGHPHKFSIYVRAAVSEKHNDLYSFFPLKEQCSQRDAGWAGDGTICMVHAIRFGKNHRDYLYLQRPP